MCLKVFMNYTFNVSLNNVIDVTVSKSSEIAFRRNDSFDIHYKASRFTAYIEDYYVDVILLQKKSESL